MLVKENVSHVGEAAYEDRRTFPYGASLPRLSDGELSVHREELNFCRLAGSAAIHVVEGRSGHSPS